MGYANLFIDAQASTAKLKELDKSNAKATLQGLLNLLSKGIGGAEQMSIQVVLGAVKASGTLTLDTAIATDEVVVNGVTFTCVSSGAGAEEFNVGASDTDTATNLAASINASSDAAISGIVVASSSAAVVTVTAVRPGLQGNTITLASNDATITASAARLASGSDGDTETLNLGKAAS